MTPIIYASWGGMVSPVKSLCPAAFKRAEKGRPGKWAGGEMQCMRDLLRPWCGVRGGVSLKKEKYVRSHYPPHAQAFDHFSVLSRV